MKAGSEREWLRTYGHQGLSESRLPTRGCSSCALSLDGRHGPPDPAMAGQTRPTLAARAASADENQKRGLRSTVPVTHS